jgi:ribosomal protein S18 acetylase RimI-like enzyme
MIDIRFPPAGPGQAELFAALHARCFEDAWPLQAFAGILAMPEVLAAVAVEHDGAQELPMGLALIRSLGLEAELLTVCIVPQYRRRGIATELLNRAAQRAHKLGADTLFLEVDETNDPAQALYTSWGFIAVGRRPDYYRRPNQVPAAALILRADLTRFAA